MNRKPIQWLFLMLLFTVACVCESGAQKCGDDLTDLKKELATTRDPKVVFRAAAVGGKALIPLLKTLSKPEQHQWTVPGAAQVSLARLEDPGATDELRSEIRRQPSLAIEKLAVVRSEASLSILMQYLIEHKNPSTRIIDLGDYFVDPLRPAIQGMIEMLEAPPYSRANTGQVDGWQKWWEESKSPHIRSISEDVADSQASCLARLAEWGYVDAVDQLYLKLGRDSVPLLRRLARLGDKAVATAAFGTVRGTAQTILAREGDKEEFDKIVKELDDSSYQDAIVKLQRIGGPASFEALLRSLGLQTFMAHSDRDRKYVDAEGVKLKVAVMAALSGMVTNPPLPPQAQPTPENMKKWTAWWEANKDKIR